MTACSRPGCEGSVEDGYCNVCGMAASQAQSGSGSSPAGQPEPGHGSFSLGSASLGSASLGSASLASLGSSPASGRTTSGRSRPGSTGASRRGMLGAGLVEVPPVPYRDPATAILANPEVAERKRFCSDCGKPVGRGQDGRPGRTDGFCRNCGTRFSFTPKLARGDVVGGQYEVLGCMAHGGLGWIYLAHDRNVSDRWVVLKGLLDTGDADAMAAALAERQFLARVEHPNIIKIYNFVQHPEPGTGTLVGYIVMEYVGGQSLKDMMLARRQPGGSPQPLPLGQAIAYALEVLRALGYLHSLGLLYCDFKPDNVIQSEEQLKLIDLGGVRRLDDDGSAVYGTVGYQAPEIAADGPSISSDLYTVARALAVLTFDFQGYTGKYADRLPDRGDVALLSRFESYDRLLRRATDPDPSRRFGSAAEMAEQLTGVLREVLAAEDGQPRPAGSGLFGPESRTVGTDVFAAATAAPAPSTGRVRAPGPAGRPALRPGAGPAPAYAPLPLQPAAAAAGLPVPLVDGTDPAAGFLAGISAAAPADVAAILANAPVPSPEVRLRLARTDIELADFDQATALLDELAADDPEDWRPDWYRALAELARGRPGARGMFDALYSLLPGEAAPKLGLALAAELDGDLSSAGRYYAMVWSTDQSYVTAAFGLARVRLAQGARADAVLALDSVPATSIHYIPAQVAAIAARIRGLGPAELDPADVLAAGSRLEALGLDVARRERLEAEVLEAALAWVQSSPRAAASAASSPGAGRGHAAPRHPDPSHPARPHGAGPAGPGGRVLGRELTERELRYGLERAYRTLAHLAANAAERIAMVDRANMVRPRTLL
jgi:serine/threonine-protein kinase PknG